VFDRVTGQPVWPIVETPVPRATCRREGVADAADSDGRARQAVRLRARLRQRADDLIDFTPALRAEALENLKRYRHENSPYVPLILGDANGLLGTINIGNTGGGTNWPGGGLDPELHIFYSQATIRR
jgi:quinoprotein glucose dehydrogenase